MSCAITGVAAGSPSSIAEASIATSSGVKPARAATVGSTRKTVAGPLMVLSIPFSRSTTPSTLPIASATWGAHWRKQRGIGREQLDLDRLGRVRQIADHVLQHLDELDVDRGLLLLDLGPQLGDDVVDAAAALAFQLHGDVAGIRFGDRSQAELQTGAPRVALAPRESARSICSMWLTMRLVSSSEVPAGVM